MAESPQERSPGVLSRIGSWLSWGWGRDDPTSQTQQEEAPEEDHRETRADETDSPSRGETSPTLDRNAKHLRLERSRSLERRRPPEIFDQMGRRRSGRRRRSSHGDGGGAKSPTNPQPESPAATSLTSGPRKACADSAFEEAANSLPEASGAEEPNSGNREDVVREEWAQASLSEGLVELVYSDMDEERVVRLTESAESKRRSIKVSHSEVVFAKKVVVASEDQNEDRNVTFKDTADTKRPRSDERARFPEDRVDGTNVKSSHHKARIADKISLFERGATSAISSSTNLLRLDISPARNVASRLRDFTEHAGTRSSSAPPNQTVKERAKNFSAGQRGEEKLMLPSGRMLNEGHSKTAEISCSGHFGKSTAKTDTSGEPKVKSKPHLNIDQTDSKSYNATPALSESTSDSNVGNKEPDSLPTVLSPTDETPQVKSPNRTGTRSKKRRGKDPLSPTKQEMGQGKQEVKDNKDKPLVDARYVVKTTEQSTSDKERPNSAGEVVSKKPTVPPKLEKASEIMQSTKKKSNSKNADTKVPTEVKSKDEKERENSGDFEAQIVAVASDTHPSTSRKNSSNKEKIQTDIDSKAEEKQKNSNKKQPVQECSEGEQGDEQRNKDLIVNSLFGESGKPDPSVTNDEKPPSPEDLKEATSKDSSEPANSSAAAFRNDAMQNRGSETDTLVLPEKDTTAFVPKAKNTPENNPKSAQRLSKINQKSQKKDCLTEITSQNQKNDLVTETTDQLKTTEKHKHSNEVNTSKDTSAVRQEDTTIMATSQGKETQTTEKNSSTELSDQTKENTTSTSKTLATPNSALVKDQNDQMDTIISPQIAPTEGGGPERDGPLPRSQSESGEEQNTQTVSSKRDLQQQQQKPSTETKKGGTKETRSKITSTEMTSIVNGDIHSVETEDQFSDSLKQPGEEILGNTLPEIPISNNESLSLSSFSSEATEASTEQSGQVSKKFTAKPASTDDTAFSLPASSNTKNTTLSNTANKKTTNEKTTPPAASPNATTTPEKPTTIEKTPQASTNEKTSTLPATTKEKTTPPPATTTETISASLGSSDDGNKPQPASTNKKNKTPSESANKRITIKKTTSPQASTNEKSSTLPASTKEKTTPPPATTTETISASLGSSDDGNKPLPASTNEVISSLPASTNAKTTPPLDSIDRKTTDEKDMYLLASTDEKIAPASSNKKKKPPPASTNETISALPDLGNEKTTHSASSTVESTSTTLGSGDDKTTPPSDLTNEMTTTPPASTNEKTTSSLDSASRKTNNEETMPPPASTNETTNEKTKPSPASTNDKTTPAKSPTKENAAPPPASTTETISASLSSSDEKNKLPPASTNPPVSIDITTKKERTTPLPASSSFPITSINGENITPLPSSKEKTTSPPDYDSGKPTPSPESVNEKPSALEVSAKQKISSSKSKDPSTRKKEFVLKPFLLPQIPAAPGSSSQSRDSPSSWLDVDHQRPIRKKLLIPEPKLSSSVSETNLLNTSGEFDPDDFIANVKRLAMPFNIPQRKHNKHRLQTPPFAMPAIKEDRFEKPFDPEEFQHGLRRRREFILDLAPSSISKSQATIVKEPDTKPKRESILTRSLIFQRARKGSEKEDGEKEEGSDENTTEPLKAKSRLERCSIVSILSSPSKGRRMEFLSPTECPSDWLLSPSDCSGSTAPPQSQLAPTTEPPKLVPVEETLAKNDSHGTQSGSQIILKPNKDIGPAATPDLKTTSREPRVTLSTDTNAPSPPSGTQTSFQVVPKPTKDDGPNLEPNLKTNSADPPVTMLTDTNAPPPSCTQSGSQVVQKPTKDDGLAMTPDLKTTSRDPTVTLSTDTNTLFLLSGTQTSSQVVLKPTKDDGPTLVPDLKTTSLDPPVTMLTDTNAPSPPNGTHTSSQFVPKPMKDDGPTLTPDLKTISLDPPVTMLTDIKAPPTSSYTQSGSQNVLKPIKDDGPAMTPDLRTTSRDPTVTMFTDTNAPPLLIGTQTGSDVVLRPDGPTLKTTPVDANAPPPLPSFDDIKLPSFLEEFLPKEPENAQPSNKIDPLVAGESASIPGLVDLNKAVYVPDGKIPEDAIPPASAVPAAQIPQAKPQRELPNISAARGIHRRPGKIVIFEHHQFSGQSFEFFRDQPDATHMQLSSVISIKVVRGCWILYEKPGFEGRCIALEEEGVIELPNQWAEEGEETSMVIGSIRLAIRDYTPPRIELFTEPAGRGRSSEYVDYTEEVGSFSQPQNTGSIKVHSGLWLVYSDPGFQGLLAVLQAGEYPFPEDWGFPSPAVGSLRPLRMGALRVEKPDAVEAVVYEKAGLEGRCVEVQGDVTEDYGLDCVESLKILGGLWVGYDGQGFEGQQFVLEEGEYLDWRDWGGTGDKLFSLRPVFMDFSSPHMKMFSEPDFSERGVSIDLLEPLENTANTSYGLQTRSIEVLSGVWVAFEGPGFSGQQYVLEKGLYGSPEDWGSSHSRISSAVPVVLENLENSCHFQIELFSESGFGGTSVLLQDSLPTMPCGFSVRSCRVHAGSWLAFSRESFSGHQCVLEEGFYPDLWTMSFTQLDTSVLSLQPTGYELSVPAAVLFERSGLRGRRTVLKSDSVNLQLTHSCSRVSSVLVLGGIWVLYEDHNFRGSQLLLKPGAVPDWPKLSSWLRIGSLRPLMQKQVHFRLRSKEAGLLMSVSGSLDDIKLMRIQVSEERGGAEQIWTYQNGHLQSKCVLDVCVDVSSGVLMSGSRAVLSDEAGKPQQLWNVTSDGIIRSHARPELVLEVKGGQQFDKHQIILNEFHPDKLNQRWSLEIL